MKNYLFPVFIFVLFMVEKASAQCTSPTPTNATIPSYFNTCDNKTTTLTVIASGTVDWYATPTSTVSLFTGTSFITPILAAGSYTFYAACTSGTCTESIRLAYPINVFASPTNVAVYGGTVLICDGAAVTLTATGADTYSWSTGATTSTVVLTPSVNTTYTAIGTATSNGCKMSVVKTITVGSVPSLSISGSGSVCAGQAAILNILGADTYSWNTGATTTLVVVSPTTTTNYTVIGTYSATGCNSTATISIMVSPCTGIANSVSEIKGLTLFPNPNNGEFTIELNNGFEKTISITDLTGKIIKRTNSINTKVNVDIKDLAPGIYFVRIKSNNISENIKVIKQ